MPTPEGTQESKILFRSRAISGMGYLSPRHSEMNCGAPVEPLGVVFAQVPKLRTKLGNEGWNLHSPRQGFFSTHV